MSINLTSKVLCALNCVRSSWHLPSNCLAVNLFLLSSQFVVFIVTTTVLPNCLVTNVPLYLVTNLFFFTSTLRSYIDHSLVNSSRQANANGVSITTLTEHIMAAQDNRKIIITIIIIVVVVKIVNFCNSVKIIVSDVQQRFAGEQ